MSTKRNGSAGKGKHRYKLSNDMEAVRMWDGWWRIFNNKGADPWDANDQGVSFKTLRECREWGKKNGGTA